MAKDRFIEASFRAKRLATIAQANEIIGEYQRMGFTLTLRQLYYQFVSRDLIPNKQREYKNLGETLNLGRLAGLIDWSAIEDRTRNMTTPKAWDSPQSILDAVAEQYQENLWKPQPWRFVQLIEKEALIGVIEPICEELRIPYMACKGYLSQSEAYELAQKIRRWRSQGYRVRVLHLGDHDPSGMQMTEDNGKRLSMLSRLEVDIRRLALNMDQVEQYNPPPNPAKETDSRWAAYEAEYGDSSWELDALDPPVIAQLIRDAVEEELDPDLWSKSLAEEVENKATLAAVSENFEDVKGYLRSIDALPEDFGEEEE